MKPILVLFINKHCTYTNFKNDNIHRSRANIMPILPPGEQLL